MHHQTGRHKFGRRRSAGEIIRNQTPMAFQNLTLEVADRIATLTVNRPDKLNALNDATIAELGHAIDEIRLDEKVAGVILTGAGRAFVAGADISELASQTPVLAKARSRAGQDVFRRIETCPKPVIAAVNGFALGGGCELAMACHIRIASEAAKFGQPESKLGILPGFGGSQRLARLVGKGRAIQLLLTGEQIDAAEGYRIGLVNRVVHPAELMGAAKEMMKQILANGPLAVALCIEAVDRGLEMSLDEGLILEANHFGLLAATEDMREGMRAFLDKRTAAFKGR
jgi:enoyl-CoA hydratase